MKGTRKKSFFDDLRPLTSKIDFKIACVLEHTIFLCTFEPTILKNTRGTTIQVDPKNGQNQLIRGSQMTLFAFKNSQFGSNWPPENSNFGVQKHREPKTTCL